MIPILHSVRNTARLTGLLAAIAFLPSLPARVHAAETDTPPAAGWWSFDPSTDAFSPKALFDLRSLNEKTAGESGFVKRTAEGNDFALGNGKPVRFWAVDEYVQDQDDDAMLAHKARWLAKRGVNMVRVHTQIADFKPGASVTDHDQKAVERVWRLVAAMKKEGIYTTVSPYWGVSVKAPASWGIPGWADQNCPAILFFDPTLQKGYKAWLKALYAPVNPHDGLPLSKDPAMAIIQLQNEDSLLFWTLGSVKGEQLTALRGLYGAWLKKKYGSLDAANRTWGGASPDAGEFQEKQGDEFAQGHAGLYIIWWLTGQSPRPASGSYKAKRLADQLAFLTETMARFNTEMTRYLRDDLGCKQLVNAGNWRPADPVRLMDAERASYLPDEVMGVNRYFDGAHEGPDTGWAIRVGDRFTNASALLDPRGLPTNVKQPVGHPFIIPETEWVAPDGWQAEGPFLTAAYESLTGVDTAYFFADGDSAEWQPPFRKLPWNPPTGKWQIATPMQMGQFPAAALMYRQGYIARGAPAVHEERSLQDVYERRSPLIAEEGGFDPNRDSGDLPPRSAVKTGVDPLAFLVGPVEVKYGGDPSKSKVIDLSRYIDTTKRTVASNTGQIRLNYGTGLCVINAPSAQGAVGFLRKAGGPIALSDITISSSNEYAAVTVVSLDGKPIRTSKKLLIQVGTIARPTGWEDKEAAWQSRDGKQTFQGRQVVSVGRNPWQIANADMTLTITNPGLTRATLLDANGMTIGKIPGVTRSGAGQGRLTARLPPNTLYAVVE